MGSLEDVFAEKVKFSDSHFHSLLVKSRDYASIASSLHGGIDISVSFGEAEELIRRAETADNVGVAVGAGPWCVPDMFDGAKLKSDVRFFFEKFVANPKVAAIGEIGLDYFHEEYGSRELQKKLFADQAEYAAENHIPAIIHSRESLGDVLDMMSAFKPGVRWLIHCFSYDRDAARRFLDLGCYIAFGGAVTYKGNDFLRDAAAYVPSDSLLLETDSPYLAPVPKRGEENVPENVALVGAFLASLRGVGVEGIAAATNRNADSFLAERRVSAVAERLEWRSGE